MSTIMSEAKSLHDIGSATVAYEPRYIQYLKSLYSSLMPTKTSDHQWPPSFTGRVFNLAMIKEEKLHDHGGQIDNFVRMTITGKIDDILHVKSRIELCDVFKEAKQKGKRKVILMEGAPGCGKSTLSIHISQQWGEGKLFQEFEAVILVKLRDPVVQSAQSIADLFPSNDDSIATAQQALEKMSANNFRNVLFILDGWDELRSDLRKDSIFLDLIKPDLGQNKALQESSVIVTSRPIASSDLHDLVSLRIEILGFTPDEFRNYFSDCLDGDAEAVKCLIETIEENPAVAGMCRLPLNASILVHLYKEQNKMSLPTSQYGIFSMLICTCVSRHLKERTQHKSITLESLDQILTTEATERQFKFLCKLAYEGVMNDKIVFSSLPCDIDTLSLLQGVESFIKHKTTSTSYNFIHLSIQEVLAALYMAKSLAASEQVAKFYELFDKPRFIAVFQFYAAITKLKTSGIRDIINQIGKRCGELNPEDDAKTLLKSLLHCLNEAQDQSLCNDIINHLQYGLDLGHITLSPADCWSIGYFLSSVCVSSVDEFQVHLHNCGIDDQGCRYLAKGLQKRRDDPNESTTVLYMNLKMNCIGEKKNDYLSQLFQASRGCISALHLNGNSTLSDNGIKCISDQLSKDTSLEELGIFECGVTADSIGEIATALMTNTSLKVLNVGANAIYDHGIEELARALQFNKNLESLNLACCGITNIGLQHIVDSLQQNTSLTELKLNNFLFQEHPNVITDAGDAIHNLFSLLKKRPTPLTLVLPKDFKSSITAIQEDINNARVTSEMAPVYIEVDGHTLAEIEREEEDEDESEAAQSDITEKDDLSEESDVEERDGTRPPSLQTPDFHQTQRMQKSASFRYAEEEAEIPFLHHEVLECDHRGLIHTISDHDMTLRIPEGAVSKGKTVHFELGVSMYGPFEFPENTRPISPIIWLCLLEEDSELQEELEMHVPHFFMHLTEQRIRQHKVRFAKAHHDYSVETRANCDMSYSFHQFGSQPSFIHKEGKCYAVLASKHCCFLCLSVDNSRELAMDAGYCLIRIEPSPYCVLFLATFFMETCLTSLKEQFGIGDDQIAKCSCFRFKESGDQEPHIRVILSKYPRNITVAKEPANSKIKASDIDFWNFKQDFIKLKLKMKMYPPRVKLTIMVDPSRKSFKLPIKFDGCLDEDLDTELIFPLESPLDHNIISGERVLEKTNVEDISTRKGQLTGKRKRSDSDEHMESRSKIACVTNMKDVVQDTCFAASSSVPSAEQSNKINKLAQPTAKNLMLIKYMDKRGQKKELRIKKLICYKWKEIGTLLEIESSSLNAWEMTYHRNVFECINPILDHWFEHEPDDYPVSWDGLKKILEDVELSQVAKELDLALCNVDGHTLAEIELEEEDKDESEAVQSDITEKDNLSEESDVEERDGTRSLPLQIPEFHQAQRMQKSASFRYAEEEAKIPFLHHEVLECDHRGLTHTISDHDITLRVPEGAVSKGKTVHFELGVSMYGPFRFPENTRPISPIIWVCLLEENYELQEMFEFSVPHFLTHLTEEKIYRLHICLAKAYHKRIKEEDKKFNTDCVYNFHLLDSQPSFVSKNERDFAILASKHCCFLSLLAQNTRELAEAAGYCLVRTEPSPYTVCFSATFFQKSFINSLKDNKITSCRKFKFRKNEEEEPYIRMVIPSDSEYPTEVKVARDPTNLIIKASEIDLWKYNHDRDYMELVHEMQLYPPRVTVAVRMDPSRHSYKLPIKFEGCMNENLGTELMFPLNNPPLILSEDVCMANTSNASAASLTVEARPGVKRSRTDSDDEYTESSSKVLRITKPASSERVSQIPERSKSDHMNSGAVHVHPETNSVTTSLTSTEQNVATASYSSPATIASDVDSSTSATPLTVNPPLPKGRVTFKHVTLIKWKDDGGEEQLFYLTDNIAHEWRTIGGLLGLNYSKTENLAEKHRDRPKECCRAVLGLWLENPPKEYPNTWQGLVDLLKHSKLSGVVAQLRNVLNKATDL